MSQDISLINSTLPSEVENYIISAFLDAPNLVKFSLVNKRASLFLSNEKFKELFADRHPHLCKSAESLQKKFQYLCDRYPTKCWKIASCVFETGNLNFTASVLSDGCVLEINFLEGAISRAKPELKKICGKDYEDWDSPIHQAWLEHVKTKDVLGDNPEAFVDSIVQERKEEFAKILSKNQPIENTIHEIVAFDERLLPYANYVRYQRLEETRKELASTVDTAEIQLEGLKNPENGQPNLTQFECVLDKFFHDALKDQLIELINNQKPLTDEECKLILSKFNVIIEAWAKGSSRFGSHHALSAYRSLTLNSLIFWKTKVYSAQATANAIKMKPFLYEFAYNHLLTLYAKKPIDSFTLDSFEKILTGLCFMFTGQRNSVIIGQDLLKAIYVQHHLVATDPTNLPIIPENIKSLTNHVYQVSINAYAEQQFSAISADGTVKFAQKISDALGIPNNIVLQDLNEAIHKKTSV